MQSLDTLFKPIFRHQNGQRKSMIWISIAGITIGAVLMFAAGETLAQIPQPDPPPGTSGGNVWEVLVGWAKLAFEAILILITVGAFLVAAWAAVVGLYRLFNDRDGWATLFGVFIAAIVVTFFVGQMAYEGSQILQQLTT